MRKVCVVTGTRAEYGLLRPIMKAIHSTTGLELQVLVTGMHLAPAFGLSIEEIRADGFPISAQVDMLLAGNTLGAQAKGIGLGIIGMTQAFEQLRPHAVVVLGDRGEPLAAAIAAAHLHIPIFHLHGGESSYGSIDESVRHAITRLAHIHLAATRLAGDRLVKMGEEPWRVHVVGAPGLDSIVGSNLPHRTELMTRLGLEPSQRFVAVVYHPETVGSHDHRANMREILAAVQETGLQAVVIYPNADAGSADIIEAIREVEGVPGFRVFRNLPHEDYLGVLRWAEVLVGNSSSGIIEAPSFGLPAVNVGMRQAGRERGVNVLDTGYDGREIRQALSKALTDREFREIVRHAGNPYGDGRTGPRVARLLAELPLDSTLLIKRLSF